MKIIFCITICFLIFGCGSNSDLDTANHSLATMQDDTEIHSIAIGVFGDPLEVNEPAQLLLTATLKSGEKVFGLTTEYEDQNSGEVTPIEWFVSNSAMAFIDDGARLIPMKEGYVTVTASFLGKSDDLVVKVNRNIEPQFSTDTFDMEGEVEEEDELEAEDIVACQGHAAGVTSFTPGSNAGFGSLSFPGIVLGPPRGGGDSSGSTHVLSLGTNGEIILNLGSCLVFDGLGVDFIIFENPFLIGGDPLNPYAELAAVGVSEDGETFVEFSCEDEAYPYAGCAGWHPVYSSTINDISPFDVDNAGGDQFDLSDIGVESAKYIRIRDLGNLGFGTSVGFDLDAIAVINGMED